MPEEEHLPVRPAAPSGEPAGIGESIADVRAQLRDMRESLERVTGGAAAATVLAELAQELAGDLSQYFDDLPMFKFVGRTPRLNGRLRGVLPHRRVPHRVLLGRYLSATPSTVAGVGFLRCSARIALLTLGADGVLRVGSVTESIILTENTQPTSDLQRWNSILLQRVPSRSIRLMRWTASADPVYVARPNQVIETLTEIAASIAESSNRDLALLQRFL